ncbi:MAG: RluA family pseudouridine synthase [Oscillospiraceae bacterium]|jgi:23S rRNA pseudouridine1911/1915/1917 synthase|nr:RluA family pseudouridine synthase [Oscillospiraceae bacterium]
MTTKKHTLTAEHGGERLDVFLAEQIDELTRSAAVLLIEQSGVFVNGLLKPKRYLLKQGDVIEASIPSPKEVTLLPENISLDVVYEDSDVVIINKPKGMVVHPAKGHESGTLVNALMFHCGESLSGINGEIRPGIVHRIDKDTSGLLIVAKNDAAHKSLAKQISEHTFTREYLAVVCGSMPDSGVINATIGRSQRDRKKMAVNGAAARVAVTRYETLERYAKFSYVKFTLETGRTHQIRVHSAHIGHPVAGDAVYGNGKPEWLGGQCLHAAKLGLLLPSGEYAEFTAPLPDYFQKMLKYIS